MQLSKRSGTKTNMTKRSVNTVLALVHTAVHNTAVHTAVQDSRRCHLRLMLLTVCGIVAMTLSGQWMYAIYALLFHLSRVLINAGVSPTTAAVLATPILKLCDA